MAKSEVPISLFSFQDIVTSLTGIMVIVILVIALQMMETTQQLEQQPEDPEWQELLEENKRLQAVLAALQNDEAEQTPEEEEFQALLDMDESAVEELLAQARSRLQAALEALEQAVALRDQLAKEVEAQRSQRQAELAKIQTELSQREKMLRELANELEKLEQKIAAAREKIRVLEMAKVDLKGKGGMKARKLQFSFKGSREFTPILVECQGNGNFRAGAYLSKDVQSFSSLRALCSWLKRFDSSQYYPVLLLRRGALEKEQEIVAQVEKVCSQLGKDPIPDDVEVFP